MQTSLQLYTLRAELEQDLHEAIDRVASIGFQAVEPYNFAENVDALAESLERNGLSAPSGHAPFLSQDREPIFRAAQKLGMHTVIDPFVPAERWTTAHDIAATAAELNSAAAEARNYGLTVGYHNHWWEVETIVDGRRAIEILADHLDEDVVLEIDTYWAQVAGADVPQLLEALGSRVAFIHVKDGPGTQDPSDQVAVGQGSLDIESILAAAPHLRARVVELDDTRGDMFTAVEDSFQYLQTR